MTLVSFDIDANRIRAVRGRREGAPSALLLEPPRAELPFVVSAEGRRPEVGSAGLLIYQERPDLVYRDFLPLLAEEDKKPRRWRPETHPFNPRKAVKIVFDHLKKLCGSDKELVCSLPPYINPEQSKIITRQLQQSGFTLVEKISAPLALAAAAHAEQSWSDNVLVIDLDNHALWMSLLQAENGEARLVETFLYPRLGLHFWKRRLINALADCCILQSRRDPRDFPAAEQAMWLQLDQLMENCVQNRIANMSFQTPNWGQNLVLQPEETESFCRGLVKPLIDDVHRLFDSIWPERAPSAVLLSAEAAHLPGLAVSLEECIDHWYHFSQREMDSDRTEKISTHKPAGESAVPQVINLALNAAARGAYFIAADVHRTRTLSEHVCESAPFPEQQAADAGAARIQSQGRDHYLGKRNFTIGSRYDCDLVFDKSRFPHVSPRHCEVLYDPRRYYIKDLSREGTWINDRPMNQVLMLTPGDRIRLGPEGPVLRYLGKPGARGLTTIA